MYRIIIKNAYGSIIEDTIEEANTPSEALVQYLKDNNILEIGDIITIEEQ